MAVNLPNLHYIEDDWRFDSRHRYRLPIEFEIRDALASVSQMGGTVVRLYTLSVKKPTDDADVPRHVLGPGRFDESAFQALDLVFKLAREYSIQVIFPLVDNWHHWGGVAEYAAFRGKPRDAFWTDAELFGDFERTIEHVVLRRNSLTGTLYRDDPTLFAWETGNELEAPWHWTERAAATLKRLDPIHPVIDGIHSRFIRPEALASPLIDVLSTHHYTPAEVMVADIRQNLQTIAGRKPYFVGEFGFLPASGVEAVLDAAIDGGALGALLWSLRFHNRDGGFYWHCEKRGYQAYHWPGFDTGSAYEERRVLELLRHKAFTLQRRGLPPPLPVPGAPELLPVDTPQAISWRGSAGAESYLLERAPSVSGPWELLSRGISDAQYPYRPLYADETAEPGRSHYYRVSAENSAGVSAPSAPVGPVTSHERWWVDELGDFSKTAHHTGRLELVADDPRFTKLDRERVRGQGGRLTYRVPGRVTQVRVYAFLRGSESSVGLACSEDEVHFQRLKAEHTDFYGGVDQFEDAPHPVLLRAARLGGKPQYVRLELLEGAQIGRVEIAYLPRTGQERLPSLEPLERR